MNKWRALAILVSGFAVSQSACAATPPSLAECDDIVRTYLYRGDAVALRELERSLPTYDMDTQFSIYVCGTKRVHPPLFSLAEPIASQGSEAAIYLKGRLQSEHDDWITISVLELAVEMQRLGSYDVRRDSDFMTLLRDEVGNIHDSNRRSLARGIWDELQ